LKLLEKPDEDFPNFIHQLNTVFGFMFEITTQISSFRRNLDYQDVLAKLAEQGISIRVASPKLVMEEVRYPKF
jgi:hypothetical protein